MSENQFQMLKKCFKGQSPQFFSYSPQNELKCLLLNNANEEAAIERSIIDAIFSLFAFLEQEKNISIRCAFGVLKGVSLCQKQVQFDVAGDACDELLQLRNVQ